MALTLTRCTMTLTLFVRALAAHVCTPAPLLLLVQNPLRKQQAPGLNLHDTLPVAPWLVPDMQQMAPAV